MNVADPVIKFATPSDHYTPFTFGNDLEKIQFILYQSVYCMYLKMIHTSPTKLVYEYIQSIEHMMNQLNPNPNLSSTDKEIYNAIYHILKHGNSNNVTWKQIDEVLSYPCSHEVIKTMVPHRDFYLPLLSARGYGYPSDVYLEGKKPSAILLTPELIPIMGVTDTHIVEKRAHGGIKSIYHNTDATGNRKIPPYAIIYFHQTVLPDYDFNLVRKLENTESKVTLNFFEYLSGFNLSSMDLDAIIGRLASFAIEKGKYATSPGSYNDIFSAAYDTITGSNTLNYKKITPPDAFFKMLNRLNEYHRIGNLEDTKVFSIFISKCDMDPDVSGYLAKPAKLISANEALAFRNSDLVNFIPDKMLNLTIYKKATEAMEDGDIPPEDDALNTDDQIPEDPDAANFPDDNIPLGDGTPPPRDPLKLLLELADPSETLADVIYKKLVSARIRDLLKNTPKELPIKEVLLLKKWLTHWINLVSVNSVKDFLSRLSFRLNDIELTHKSI